MISFIIPSLNEEKYLGKTLEYISKYSLPHEIIVCDNGSSDRTLAIARQYTDKVFTHDSTIAYGRNMGAKNASGEYLVFLDSEICILEPNIFFKKALQCFQDDKKLNGLTCQLRIFKNVETLGDKIIIPLFISIYVCMNNYLGIGSATTEFQMIPADIFRKIGGFKETLVTGEDQDMFRRLARIGKTRLELELVAYHVGRRAHAFGWPKLLYTWGINSLSVLLFEKSVNEKWEEIR